MSYKTMRRALRELSLESLVKLRQSLWAEQRSSRSPARKVQIEGQLQLVGAAIDRAFDMIEHEEAEMLCA